VCERTKFLAVECSRRLNGGSGKGFRGTGRRLIAGCSKGNRRNNKPGVKKEGEKERGGEEACTSRKKIRAFQIERIQGVSLSTHAHKNKN